MSTIPNPPSIDPCPSPAPTTADPTNFDARADQYHSWLPNFVNTQLANTVGWIKDRARDVLGWSNSASTSAAAAQTAQTAAQAASTAAQASQTAAQTAQAAAQTAATTANTKAAEAATSATAAAQSSATAGTKATEAAASATAAATQAAITQTLRTDLAATGTGKGAELVAFKPNGVPVATSIDRAVDSLNPASSQTQQVMQRLLFNESCNMIVLGDSTGDEATEWVQLLAQKIGQDFASHTVAIRRWNSTSSNYDAAINIQTGSTAATLTVWNASIAGSNALRFAGADLEVVTRPAAMGQDPDLIIMSYGHNGGADIETQISMTSTMAAEVTRFMPFTPVILIGQNPVTTNATMAEKVRVFRSFAATFGFGWIDVHAFFRQFAVPIGNYYADTVHPNNLGSELWANAAHQAFRLNRNAVSGGGISTLSRGVVYSSDSYAGFAEWTLTAGVSMSRDAAVFETNGESAKLTGLGTTAAFISRDVIGPQDIQAYQGRYVTAAVRLRVPGASADSAGQIALHDGITTILMPNAPKQGDWVTTSVTLKVGASATFLRCFVYLSTSAGTTDVIHVDRVTVSDGPYPMDEAITNSYQDIDYLRVFGGNIDGQVVVRNENSGSAAIQVLHTNGGTNQDNPLTQYACSLSSIGIRVKNRDDAHPRFQVSNNGVVSFGFGAAAPAVSFYLNDSTLLALRGASLYNDADSTYDLGLSNKRWRVVYGGQFNLTGGVSWRSGSGSPEGLIAAPVGSMYSRTDGGPGTSLYVKEVGSGATGWAAK